jgi:hypothetical protein
MNRRKFLATGAGAVAAIAVAPALALLPKAANKSSKITTGFGFNFYDLQSCGKTVVPNTPMVAGDMLADVSDPDAIHEVERVLEDVWSRYTMQPDRMYFSDVAAAERFKAQLNAWEFEERMRRRTRGFVGVRLS